MDVALGREGDPNDPLSDQPLTLALISVYRDDMLRYAFPRNGIEYTTPSIPKTRAGSSRFSNRGNSRSSKQQPSLTSAPGVIL